MAAVTPTSAATACGAEVNKQSPVQVVLRSPTFHVVCAVVLGVALGLSFRAVGWASEDAIRVLGFPGDLWLKSLKCIVLPMIVFAMIQAMVMLRSLPGARTVGVAVVGFYTLTTLIAAIEGCLVSVVMLGPLLDGVLEQGVDSGAAGVDVPELAEMSLLDSILGIFDGLVPSNIVGDAANARFLQVIVASILLGLLVKDKREDGSPSLTMTVVSELNDVVVKVITYLMKFTPVGVGCLVFSSAASMDLAATGQLVAVFVASVTTGFAIHALIVYPAIIAVGARRNPFAYLLNMLPAILTALGTASSAATLPVTTRCTIENNKVRPHVAKFVLSLGATINMDGTGLWLICSVFFLGRIEGVEFTAGKFILMSVLAMLCSLGSAPVPSAGLVLLATMLSSAGVPLKESFGLVVAIDWLLDRGQTMVNVTGDSAVTAVVDKCFGDACAMANLEDAETCGDATEQW